MAAEAALEPMQRGMPVGILAIGRALGPARLVDQVSAVHTMDFFGQRVDCIALPHSGGLST